MVEFTFKWKALEENLLDGGSLVMGGSLRDRRPSRGRGNTYFIYGHSCNLYNLNILFFLFLQITHSGLSNNYITSCVLLTFFAKHRYQASVL